jgi:ferredoxin
MKRTSARARERLAETAGVDRRDFLKRSALGAAGLALPACGSSQTGEVEAKGARPHRYIDEARCIGCGQCVPLCPMGAIHLESEFFSRIDPRECAECGTCLRANVCPEDAIREGKLSWPRVLREVFSNPLAEHEATGVPGRGTEGIKTNDVEERYREGFMGVFVELGRPVLGARFADAERVVQEFTAHGFPMVEDNPVAGLIANPDTGAFDPEVLNEKAISILIEFVVPQTAVQELMTILRKLSDEANTVFNISVALRAREGGRSPLSDLFGSGVQSLPNGKVNLGLARGIARNGS